MQQIIATPTVPETTQDVLRWIPSKNGRSILPLANQILQRVWKMKTLPPIIKTFTWRMIRRALATTERASRYSTHIDPYCATYGQIEDDAHLFFHCQLPRAVWFSFTPPLRTDLLPQDNDGVSYKILLQMLCPMIPYQKC